MAADGSVGMPPSQALEIHLVLGTGAYARPIASLPAPDLGLPERERGWLDLFYDLVFVAAILILSSAFSHAEEFSDGLWFVAAFVAVWWVWLATTLHANRFPEDTVGYRLVALVQMFLVALVAVGASDGARANAEFDSVCYALLALTVALTYARSSGSDPRRSFARRRAIEYGIAAISFGIAAFVPEVPQTVLWLLGLGVMIVPAIAHCVTAPPMEEEHLVERFAALTIIMCGEAFVKVALAADSNGLDHIDVLAVGLEFVLVFAIWTCYFDDVPAAGASTDPERRATWLGGHLLLHLGIVGVAVGVARFVTFAPDEDIPTIDVAAVAIPLAMVYAAFIVISLMSRRRPLGRMIALRVAAIVSFAVIVAVAEWATWFDTYWSVAAFVVVAVVHAVLEARARQTTIVLPVGDEPNQLRR
jgi:low temperature requirement protein LtrA